MYKAKLTTNGRVTIPAEFRQKYNLRSGRKIKFEETGVGLRIIPLVTHEEIKANIGFLKVKGKSLLKDLMEEKKFERKY